MKILNQEEKKIWFFFWKFIFIVAGVFIFIVAGVKFEIKRKKWNFFFHSKIFNFFSSLFFLSFPFSFSLSLYTQIGFFLVSSISPK